MFADIAIFPSIIKNTELLLDLKENAPRLLHGIDAKGYITTMMHNIDITYNIISIVHVIHTPIVRY